MLRHKECPERGQWAQNEEAVHAPRRLCCWFCRSTGHTLHPLPHQLSLIAYRRLSDRSRRHTPYRIKRHTNDIGTPRRLAHRHAGRERMRTDVFVDQEHVVLVRLAPLLISYLITAYPPWVIRRRGRMAGVECNLYGHLQAKRCWDCDKSRQLRLYLR